METRTFVHCVLPTLVAAGILLAVGCLRGVTPAEISEACKIKKAGDIVRVNGRNVTCQTPAPEVAEACKNKKHGDIVRIGSGSGKDVKCPPACCYTNGCIYPENRQCL